MRIVIELKRDVNANIVLNNLYKHSQLEDTFSIIMLSLVNGVPRILNLKQILYYYVEHQKDVVTRRTKFELNKAQARAHILEGLRIALDNIDAVISLIRASKTTQEAKSGLMEKFGLTDIQAQAILDMRLQRLTGLERDKIEAEYEELIKKINRLKEILANERLLLNVIKEEMLIIKENYADERRTEIRHAEGEIDMRDLIEDEEIAITLTHFGYIKRLPADTYKSQKRGGRGISALTTREEDFVKHLVSTTTHSKLLFFTNKGRVFRLNAYEIPEGKRQAKGTAIVNLLQLGPNEKIATLLAIDEKDDNKYLLLATKNGIVKKTDREEFKNINKAGLIAIGLREDDELIGVKVTDGNKDVLLVTKEGMSIRFDENDIGEYVLAFAKDNDHLQDDLFITEVDIDNFIRTKGAIYSGAATLVESLGMDFDCVDKVYIAGGIGNHLNIENSVFIGLLPDIDRDKFQYIGNSSLIGSYLTLLSDEAKAKLEEISDVMTYVELSVYPTYMDEFISCCFLPHTNIDAFPSVKAILEG